MTDAIGHRIGNYHHDGIALFKRRAGRKEWIVGYATAYNAFGLIGPEHNGIFVLNDTDKDVVLDQHMIVSTGYFGPEKKHRDELSRLKRLPDDEFFAWIKDHPRARDQYRA